MRLTVQLPTRPNSLGRLRRPWSLWWLAPRPISGSVTPIRGPVPGVLQRFPKGEASKGVSDWRCPGTDVPAGLYELREIVTVPPNTRLIAEFGAAYLLFEPLAGEAAEAEAYGRLALAVHGGTPGRDGRLRSTSGHLRVSDDTLAALLKLTERAAESILLEVVREDRAGPAAPSASPAVVLPLPNGVRRRFVPRDRDSAVSDDTWTRTRDPARDDTPSVAVPWRGLGGALGGAGSSGSWADEGPERTHLDATSDSGTAY